MQLSPSDSGDFVLEWMAATTGEEDDDVLAIVDGGKAGEVEVFAPTLLAPGKHYFRVRLSRPKRRRKRKKRTTPASEQRYRLTTTVIDPTPGMESEPNGTVADAGVLRPGEPRTGYLGWFQDADWYALDLSSVPENARARVDLTGVPGVKSRLWVVDKKKRGLVKVPEAKLAWPIGSKVTVRDIAFDPRGGPYYVEVKSMRSSNPHDAYTLTLRAEAPPRPHEREPNWRPSSAWKLTPDEPVDGFVGHPTDWDVYAVTTDGGPKVATVVVTGIPDVDLKLELLDAGRKVLQTVNESPAGQPETFPQIPVADGKPAYVRISSANKSFDVERGYRVVASLEDLGDREIEPNDGFGQAGKLILPVGTPFEAYVHPKGDRDYFAIDVTAETPDETRILTLRVTAPDQGVTLIATLFDEQEAMITRKGGIRAGQTRTITHGFLPGRYYVRVEDEGGQRANGQSAYTIELTE